MLDVYQNCKILSLIIFFALIYPSILTAEDADELYRQRRFSEAEKAYQKADMDNPRDIRYRYNRGCAAFQNSDYKGAFSAFSSVLRRAQDNDMRYKASYNLGNTAFVQGDFASAIEFYKMAIVYNPNSNEAKYNLELSLRKLSEAEKNRDQNKDGQEDNEQKDGDKKGSDQDQEKGEDKGRDKPEEKKGNDQGRDKGDEKGDKQDLSGKLSSADPMKKDEQDELTEPEAAALLDRKKAEALLDNINEDRTKILEFQVPKDKKNGVRSGKSW
ncbi:MAG: tetratricopeptide repeat protein [Spirochaetota bacterium]|nr:tetratricopeptide repeat protein [Spirochaetota bacterium]